MILDPVIVTGIPRSRTSMTMQMLELSGLFLGNVIQETKANPQGQKEHRKIIDTIQKRHLTRHKFDGKGQNPLPPVKWYIEDKDRRDKVLKIMESEGLKPMVKWGFKDSKAVLDWRAWDKAFPNAIWIVTKRNTDEIVDSCLRTSFMSKYKDRAGWEKWIKEYDRRIHDLFSNVRQSYRLDTDQVVNYNFSGLQKVISACGLEWNDDKIKKQVKPVVR